ncbi:hypothetical protein Lser_V15G16458 [Lactuca serriola]
MKTLISNAISSPQFIISDSKFSSLPRRHRSFTNFPNTKPLPRYKITTLCSHPADYGGWADLSSVGDSGESNQLRRLLSSLGITEKRYAFVYLLGFVCALAVSRVRISSIVVFPACFLVFAVGFSFGIVNGGDSNDVMSLFGSMRSNKNKKKRIKDDDFMASAENLRSLVDLLSGFDINIMNLKNSMRKDVDSNRISKGDLLNYIEGVESIEQALLQAKTVIEGCTDSMVADTIDASKASNQKPSDRKKEVEGKGFNISQFINGVREKSFGSKPAKVKDTVKNSQPNILDPVVEDKTVKSVASDDKITYNDVDFRVKETYRRKSMGRMTLVEMETTDKQVFEREDYMNKDNDMRSSMKNRNFLDSEEFFQQEHGRFKNINGNNILYDNLDEKEAYNSSPSSSSEISNDMLFNDYVTEANALVKQARELLTHRGIEEDAESMLYKSTELLCKAIEMKPMSLLAVGQLGNTYLLHGELKLKVSRKLRALLSQSDYNNEVSNREEFVDYLVNVCEECEELLVKAGRKYRLALSIDGNDMRALYNWGLALSFRAQLIADIGPEAALDADKIYMAAIDKFDAMMSKSNSHTPDALFRWGVALQQRSHLKTRNFREKVKLLSQAKRLYEDALLMDSNNLQVKEALSNCVSELRYKKYY